MTDSEREVLFICYMLTWPINYVTNTTSRYGD